MRFDPATSRRNIQMGYYDTMRFMRSSPASCITFRKSRWLCGLCRSAGERHKGRRYPVAPAGGFPRRALFEHILPAVAAELRLPREAGYDDLLLALLEHQAEQLGIGRFPLVHPRPAASCHRGSTALPENPAAPCCAAVRWRPPKFQQRRRRCWDNGQFVCAFLSFFAAFCVR